RWITPRRSWSVMAWLSSLLLAGYRSGLTTRASTRLSGLRRTLNWMNVAPRIRSEEHAQRPLERRGKQVGLTVEIEQEVDGRWLTEVPELPGVLVYGPTRPEAITRAQALALRVIADRLDHGEPVPDLTDIFAVPA